MTIAETPPQTQKSTDWPSILQLGLSLFGMLSLWGMALASWQTGIFQLFNSGIETGLPVASTSNSLGIFTLGLLLLPSAALAAMRIAGYNPHDNPNFERLNNLIRPGLLMYLFPIILIVASFIITQANWISALLSPLFVIAAALPILWLLWLGKRDLQAGSPQRQWGLFASALTLGPLIIIVLELILIIIGVIFAVIFYAGNLTEIGDTFQVDPNVIASDPELINEIAARIIEEPIALIATLLYLSFFIPLIEELFKPIGVWIIGFRKPSPAQGFTAGMISGAAFALFENFTRAPTPDAWLLFVVVRIGASLMHIFTSGLMGWAIASAFSEKRYFRLLGSYILAAIIHGMWNAAPVLFAFSFIDFTMGTGQYYPSHIITTAPIFLLYLTLASFTLLVYSNRRFKITTEELESVHTAS